MSPPGQTFFSPSLANFRGQPYLIFNFGLHIAMQEIDLVNAQLIGPLYQPTIIVSSSQGVAFGASPIVDANGELLGVAHLELLGSSSVAGYVALDLDPTTPSLRMTGLPINSFGGAFIGGRVFYEEPTGVPHMYAVDSIWLPGGRAPVGSAMPVSVFTPPTGGPQVYLSLFCAGASYLNQGVPIPSVSGLLGVNPLGWTSGWLLHDNANGEARATLAIPNTPSLSGISVPVQSLTWETTFGTLHLGNTARLVVD